MKDDRSYNGRGDRNNWTNWPNQKAELIGFEDEDFVDVGERKKEKLRITPGMQA